MIFGWERTLEQSLPLLSVSTHSCTLLDWSLPRLLCPQEVRAELQGTIFDQPAEVAACAAFPQTIRMLHLYPRAQQFLNDEEYLSIMRDLLNLNSVLDDMEQSGLVPYSQRGHYYNTYSGIYRLLLSKSKTPPAQA